MPLKPPTSSLLRSWVCPQCQSKSFSTSARLQQLGPEHPRYIEAPEPPQQTLPYRPPIKGILPVPRDVFSGIQGKERADDENIAKAAPTPTRERKAAPGSREEWEIKMADARRRNLQEGLKGLRYRRERDDRREASRRRAIADDTRERRARPEREDERLTAPSHGLDLESLFHGKLEDPNREARVAMMRQRYQLREDKKSNIRKDDLHTLYMNARSFIVTPEQLESAIDSAFGTDDAPIEFGRGPTGGPENPALRSDSMWTYGSPQTIQEKLDVVNRTRSKTSSATEMPGGYEIINKDRIKRIAEGLTGGKMDDLTG